MQYELPSTRPVLIFTHAGTKCYSLVVAKANPPFRPFRERLPPGRCGTEGIPVRGTQELVRMLTRIHRGEDHQL